MTNEKRIVKQSAKGQNIQQVAGNLIIKQAEDIESTFEDAVKLINEGNGPSGEVLLERLWKLHNDKMTPRQKSNCWRLLGYSCERQEKITEAGKHFLKSKDYDPDWEKSRASEALGQMLLGNPTKAYSLAELALHEFSQNNLLWSVWIQTAPNDICFSEVESRVPEHLREDTEVAVALAVRAATSGGLEIAESYMARAEKESPDNPRVIEKLGLLMMQRAVANEPVFEQLAPSTHTEKILQQAIEYFSRSLDKFREENASNSIVRVLCNRSWAYSALKQKAFSVKDITLAYEMDEDDPNIAYTYAAAIGGDRLEDAIEALRRVLGKDGKPGVEHLLAQMLRVRKHENDLSEAITILKSRLNDLCNIPSDSRIDYISLLLDMETELSGEDSATQTLEAISDEALSGQKRTLRQLLILSKRDDKSEAIKLARATFADLDESTTVEERKYFANLLTYLKLYRPALDLWKSVTRTDSICPDTFGLIDCARFCGAENDILDLCVKLRGNNVWNRRVFEYEMNLRQRYNDWRACKQVLQEYLRNPPEEEYLPYIRSHLSHVGTVLDETELIETDLSLLPAPSDVNPQFGRIIVQFLRIGGQPHKAVDYAYELVRIHWQSLGAHLAVANFIVPMGTKPLELDRPSVIAPGTAVQYKDERTGEKTWHIIEDSQYGSPEILRNEYSVDHAYSQRMINLKKDDVFLLRGGEIQERRAVILEVLSKYHYRMNDCMYGLEDRFPDFGAVIKVAAYKEDGQIDLDPFKRMADLSERRATELLQLYKDKEKPFPVYFIAEKQGRDLYSTLAFLVNDSETRINCRSGSRLETEAAVKALNNADEIVLDEMALTTLLFCNTYNCLRATPKRLIVSEGTLLNIENWDASRIQANNLTATMGNLDGKLTFQERTRESAEAMKKEIRSLISFIRETCVIESGVALGNLNTSQRELYIEALGQPCSETLAMSCKEGRVLWTDDSTSAALFVHSLRGGTRVWTQIVFEYLLNIGVIDASTFRELTLKLISFRYWFTSLNAEAAINAISKSDWNIDASPLNEVLAHFGDANVTLDASLLSIISRLIKYCWCEDQLGVKASAITIRILNELAKRGQGDVLINTLWIWIQKAFGLDVITAQRINEVIDNWLRGHDGGIIY